MEILIVDDDAQTRDALRSILTELGHKTILEAKNGEEALKTLDSEKTRIRMVISDREMPYMDGLILSDRLAERENLDSISFLLITSDLPKTEFAEIRDRHPRIDHSLFKPFRVKILDEAMKIAYANRASKRNTMLWLGSDSPDPALLEALALKREDILFRDVFTDAGGKTFSTVLIDAEKARLDSASVMSLRKSTLGGLAVWVCLSRDPERVAPFRTICHQFLDRRLLGSRDAWLRLMEGLHRRIIHGWEIEMIHQEAKSLFQRKNFGLARKALENLLRLDPTNAESHAWLADILIQKGDLKQAIRHENESLALNPCLPKTYIKLFEILPRSDTARIAEAASLAKNFCPQNTDVLLSAAAALEASSQFDEARKIIDQTLLINPRLESARALAKKIADRKA